MRRVGKLLSLLLAFVLAYSVLGVAQNTEADALETAAASARDGNRPAVSGSVSSDGRKLVLATSGASSASRLSYSLYSSSRNITRWYGARWDGSSKKWVCEAPISEFGAYGSYRVGSWAVIGNVTSEVASATFSAPTPKASISAGAQDAEAGTFEVIADVTCPAGATRVSMAVHDGATGTTSWYSASSTDKKRWVARGSVANHRYSSGTYYATAHVVDANGITTAAGSGSLSAHYATRPLILRNLPFE